MDLHGHITFRHDGGKNHVLRRIACIHAKSTWNDELEIIASGNGVLAKLRYRTRRLLLVFYTQPLDQHCTFVIVYSTIWSWLCFSELAARSVQLVRQDDFTLCEGLMASSLRRRIPAALRPLVRIHEYRLHRYSMISSHVLHYYII